MAVGNDSISISAKDGVTLEITRDVAKQSKTLADLLASTDETRQKESISLPQFDASTLEKVFEWCEEHGGANTTNKDFMMQANFANEYARHTLTAWQIDFLDRYDAYKWELAVATSYLDVTYLYYATCLVISESLRDRRWREEVPESVSDDVLCDALRFFSYEEINERGPLEPRWNTIIERNIRALPLKVVRAEIAGDEIEVSTKEVFSDLESLNRYAVEKLSIDRFGKRERAAVRAFLSESSARLRVKCLDVGKFPRKMFRACMTMLQKLAERLNLLEEVRLDLSWDRQAECLVEEPDLVAFPACVQKLYVNVYMDDDTEPFVGFVEALCAAWNRSLSIDLVDFLSDPLPLLTKVYEKFANDGELAPLLVIVAVPRSRHLLVSVQEFAESRGFTKASSGRVCVSRACVFAKKRGNDWKIAVEYNNETLNVEINKVGK
ncbi:sulfur metabolism negative regulator SconC [Aphelenchoides avenae]|nr:sulfur metabolism negative regulator SconC [Aphelenchus avenae]